MTIYYISSGHKDGLGGNIRHMIKAHIYAINKDYEFLNFSNPLIKHSKPFYKTFSIFSKLKKIGNIPDRSKIMIYGDYHRQLIIDLIKKEFKFKNFDYIEEETDHIYNEINRLPYDQNLREYHQKIFHERDNKKYNLCVPDKINIVLHIRRGDVLRKLQDGSRPDYSKRFTSDDFYIKTLKNLMKVLPKNFEIFLFSEGYENEFEEYKKRWKNIRLQIDKEEWRYIINEENYKHKEYNKAVENMNKMIVTSINADIFLGSKSHLSHILAYLNENYCFFESFFCENLRTLKNMFLFEEVLNVIKEDTFGKKS